MVKVITVMPHTCWGWAGSSSGSTTSSCTCWWWTCSYLPNTLVYYCTCSFLWQTSWRTPQTCRRSGRKNPSVRTRGAFFTLLTGTSDHSWRRTPPDRTSTRPSTKPLTTACNRSQRPSTCGGYSCTSTLPHRPPNVPTSHRPEYSILVLRNGTLFELKQLKQ